MPSHEDIVLPSTIKVYTGLILTGIILTGVFGNLLSILSVSCYAKTATKVLYLITVNLFISGFLLDAFYYPVLGLHIIQNWPEWEFSVKLCSWTSLTENACTTVIVLSLLLLSTDRYFVTIERKALPVKAIAILSILIWAISITLHTVYTFSSNPEDVDLFGKNVSICNSFIGKPLQTNMHNMSTASIANVICLLITLLLTFRTGYHIWRGRLRGPVKTKKYIKQEFKITLIIMIFCWTFWLPKWIINILRGNGSSITSKVLILSNIVGALNSIIPMVTCLMFSKDFRRSFIDILRGCKNSNLCKQKTEKDGLKEPLAVTPKKQYQDLSTTPTFIKGHFKSCDNNLNDMQCISIDSTTLEQHLHPEQEGHNNELFEQFDSKF